jgi:hypothetical protein
MAIRHHSRQKRVILGTICAVVIIGVVVFALVAHDRNKKTAVIIPSTNSTNYASPKNNSKKTSSSNSSPAQTTTSSGTGQDKSAEPSTPSSNAQLIAPSGVFVSNHKPSLSGSSVYQQEQSVCNTTPGATCYIEFTQGTTTKRLVTQTVNSQGATYWTWDINQAGLSQGSWAISAIATLNTQTMSAQDSTMLEVQP